MIIITNVLTSDQHNGFLNNYKKPKVQQIKLYLRFFLSLIELKATNLQDDPMKIEGVERND